MLKRPKILVGAKSLLIIYVILLWFNGDVECKRFGGFGGRSRSRTSYHPSPSYRPSPSYHASPSPSYTHPSPASLSYPAWHPAPSSRPASHPATNAQNSRPLGFDNVKPVGSSSSSSSGSNRGAVGPPVHSSSNYGFNSGGAHGSNPPDIGFKPSVTQGHSGSNAPNYGFKPAEHATNTKPLGSANTGSGASGSHSGNPPPYGFKPSAPVGPATNVKPVGNLPPGAPYPIHPPPYTPHNPGIPPPAYNPAHNPAGYGPPPAYNPTYNSAGYGHPPAYSPGYGHGGYPQQPGGYGYPNQHYSGTPGFTNVNINNINTNTHHYGGGYGYGGGYPSYHYSSGDVGSGALGFFLGYSLAKVTTPTYYSNSGFYSGYTPRYDHYEVHHYYHNKDSIPAQSTIQPSTIVGCVGDSGSICPSGTTSLCTSNGAILCVASATSTVPCTDQKQGNCVKTIIPCVNGTGGCEVGQNKTLTIPCISRAQVPGNITYINNTIIVNNTTIINNNGNGTAGNATVISSNFTSMLQNGSVPLTNLTGLINTTTEVPTTVGNLQNGAVLLTNFTSLINTTTEVPATTVPSNVTSDGTRNKRETPAVPMNEFCVTILALPAVRKPTEQEKIVEQGTNIFAKFLVKALGIN